VNTLEIVLIVIVVVVLALAALGYVANRRRQEALAARFREDVERANHDLANAHAQDRGWDPAKLEAAARTALAEQHPETGEIRELALVAVVDPPGTDDDKAEFRVATTDGEHLLTLGRRGDQWVLETLS
jgi:hypothetical protein